MLSYKNTEDVLNLELKNYNLDFRSKDVLYGMQYSVALSSWIEQFVKRIYDQEMNVKDSSSPKLAKRK